MKRKTIITGILVLAVLAFSGCSKTEASAQSSTDESATISSQPTDSSEPDREISSAEPTQSTDAGSSLPKSSSLPAKNPDLTDFQKQLEAITLLREEDGTAIGSVSDVGLIASVHLLDWLEENELTEEEMTAQAKQYLDSLLWEDFRFFRKNYMWLPNITRGDKTLARLEALGYPQQDKTYTTSKRDHFYSAIAVLDIENAQRGDRP